MICQWINRKSFFICFLCLMAINSHALTPAQDLVEKMAESAKTLSYKGYFAYDRGWHSTSYYLVHLADKDADRQRLVFLDGAPLEIINNGHSFTCIHPGDMSIHSNHRGDLDSFLKLNKSLNSVWKNYEAEITGESRVADRSVIRVELKPKDQHRYPFVFFVDSQTGLMLKMLVLNTKGAPLERFHYVMIDYDNITEDDLKPGIANFKSVEHMDAESEKVGGAEPLSWELTWTPNGFQQEKTKMKSWYKSAHNESAYMYSDGLSAFSVFVEHTDQPAKAGTSKRMGSTSAISHYVSSGSKIFLVTVVGEIPLITAKQIAMSVRPIQ